MIVRLVLSHLVDPVTFGSLLEDDLHETFAVASTVTSVLVVVWLTGEPHH